MRKHSPAPWKWNHDRTALLDANGNEVIADGEGLWDLCQQECMLNERSLKRAEANANLLEAAPELLEALERLYRVASVELGKSRPDVLEQAHAAIIKANGK